MRWNITLRIWMATIFLGIIMPNPGSGMIALALLSTVFIWVNEVLRKLGISISTSSNKPHSTDTSDKAYKLAVLLEMMDEDEREDFKHQLKNDLISGGDSESLSLDALITEKRKRR